MDWKVTQHINLLFAYKYIILIGSIVKTFEQYKKLITLNLDLKMISKKDKTIPEKMYFSITSFSMKEIKHLFTDDTVSHSSDDQEDEEDLKNERKRKIETVNNGESSNSENETSDIKQPKPTVQPKVLKPQKKANKPKK